MLALLGKSHHLEVIRMFEINDNYYIQLMLERLQSFQRQGYDIEIDYVDDYIKIFINNQDCGIWSPLGALNILTQYITKNYPPCWYVKMGIPYNLQKAIA